MRRTQKLSLQPAFLLQSRSSQAEVFHAVLVQGRRELVIPSGAPVTSLAVPVGGRSMSLHSHAGQADGNQAEYKAGYKADHHIGHQLAYEAAYEAGYQIGSEAGHAAGHAAGYKTGHDAGTAAGYEAGNKTGHDAGHKAGHQSGFIQGEQGAELAWRSRVKQAEHLLQQLPAAIAQRLELLEDDMLDLVFTSLCRMLGQMSESTLAVRGQLQQALRELGERSVAVIRLHPQDIACLQDDPDTAAMLEQLGIDSNIPFLADARIALGGCIIDTQAGSLDARLEVQLQALRDSLQSVRTSRTIQAAQSTQVIQAMHSKHAKQEIVADTDTAC